MRKSREILLRFYHDPKFRFEDVVVCYIDRGAPGDETCVDGGRIRFLNQQYMEIENPKALTPIPYHRITRILYEGVPFWERSGRGTAGNDR
jgi:uncharacterized protein (UPF0248 family)